MGLWVFFLRSLLFATSFFLSISEKCSYNIRDCSCSIIMTSLIDHTYLISARMCNFAFDEMTKFSKGASDKNTLTGYSRARRLREYSYIIICMMKMEI